MTTKPQRPAPRPIAFMTEGYSLVDSKRITAMWPTLTEIERRSLGFSDDGSPVQAPSPEPNRRL